MICQVYKDKNGKIERVLAPNGKDSILFESIKNVVKDSDEALTLWGKAYTPAFKEKFGDWENRPEASSRVVDANGEPKLVGDKFIGFSDVEIPLHIFKNIDKSTYVIGKNRLTKDQVIEKVQKTLDLQKKIYQQRKGSKGLISSIENLQELLDNSDKIFAIKALIDDTELRMDQLSYRIVKMKSAIDGKDQLTNDEIYDYIKLLEEIKNFAASYTILDDIKTLLKTEIIDPAYRVKLDKLISNRREIMKDYLDYSVDMLTEWIWPHQELTNRNLQKSGEVQLIITKEQLRSMFLEAPKDDGFMNTYLGSLINSANNINALIAINIKKELEKARMEDVKIQNSLVGLFEKSEGPKNRPDQFYKKYLKKISNVKKVKQPDGTTKKVVEENFAFIQEIDYHKFDQAKQALFDSLGERPQAADRAAFAAYQNKISNWFNENIEVRPDLKEYLQKKLDELGPERFKDYLADNSMSVSSYSKYAPDMFIQEDPNNEYKVLIFSGELVRPVKARYADKAYDTVKNDPYYKKLIDVYNKANSKLPESQRLRYGIIPQVVKSAVDGVLENGLQITSHLSRIKENVKRLVTTNESIDTQYGRKGLQTLSGENVNYLPIYYNKLLPSNEVSQDVLSSVLLFSEMANKFEAFSEITPHINTLQTVILGSGSVEGSGRKVVKTDTLGQIINAITGVTIKKDSNIRTNDRLKSFIDSVFWGHENLKIELKNPLNGKVINVDKFLDKFGALNAFSTMTGNIVGGINNSVIANLNTLNESLVGKYMSVSDWGWGKAEYYSNIHNILNDAASGINKSKIGQLADLYDAIQGEFRTEYGKGVSGNALKRAMKGNTLMFINNATEHEAQITGFLGLLNHKKIKTKGGKEISLYDAYELKNGQLVLRPDVVWTENDRFQFMNTIHALNKQMHGNYNSFDRTIIQRYALGRLALMFRKYIYGGYMRRWGSYRVDYELGESVQGYYQRFASALAREVKEKRIQFLWDWSGLSQQERGAFAQTMMDLGIFVVTWVGFGLLRGDDDDFEKNTPVQNHVMLQLRRLQADVAFYLWINKDIFRLMKTPAVSMDFAGKVMDWLDQSLLTWDAEEMYYQKDSGINKKGDSKAWAKFRKIFPGIRGMTIFETPEEQLKVFNK